MKENYFYKGRNFNIVSTLKVRIHFTKKYNNIRVIMYVTNCRRQSIE